MEGGGVGQGGGGFKIIYIKINKGESFFFVCFFINNFLKIKFLNVFVKEI